MAIFSSRRPAAEGLGQEDNNASSAEMQLKDRDYGGIGRYLLSRIPTLVPPMNKAPNPIKTLLLLNTQQWLFFAVCWACLFFFFFFLPCFKLTQIYIHIGRLLRMDMGFIRLFQRLLDNHGIGRAIRQISHRDHLGYHTGADAPISRRSHLRSSVRSMG